MANIIRVGGGGAGGGSKKKLAISKLSEGDVVRIKEKGVLTDYYLAQHDYQPSLNGSGRVLFVRRNLYSKVQWKAATPVFYDGSNVDTVLNSEIKALFDADVREAMGETIIPCTSGSSTSVINTPKSLFLLSATEYGFSVSNTPVEGTSVPIASTLKTARLNGEVVPIWTRSTWSTSTSHAAVIDESGSITSDSITSSWGIQFAITLHNSCTVLPEQNPDGSYTLSLGDDDPTQQYFSLTVVGGTEQPTDVEDNTIWVNTDVDIGLVYLAPNAPDSPEVGDVWVNTTNKYNSNGTNASTNLIRVNDNPYLEINVLNISQWDGSAWVTKDGSAIYANGGWTNMALYLFNYGTRNESFEIIGRYATQSNGALGNAASIEYVSNADYAQIYLSSVSCYAVGMQFQPMVDVTNYNKLTITGQCYNRGSGATYTAYVGCSTTEISSGTLANITGTGRTTQNFKSNSAYNSYELTSDLSGVTGEVYIATGFGWTSGEYAGTSWQKNLRLNMAVLTA